MALPMTDRPDGAMDGEPSILAFAARPAGLPVSFHRRELEEILRLYGRMVAAGHWRDYAIDHLAARAVFSVYRRASETPLYQIVKDPALARKQGLFSVIGSSGLILKRGHELSRVLAVLDRKLSLVAP